MPLYVLQQPASFRVRRGEVVETHEPQTTDAVLVNQAIDASRHIRPLVAGGHASILVPLTPSCIRTRDEGVKNPRFAGWLLGRRRR